MLCRVITMNFMCLRTKEYNNIEVHTPASTQHISYTYTFLLIYNNSMDQADKHYLVPSPTIATPY